MQFWIVSTPDFAEAALAERFIAQQLEAAEAFLVWLGRSRRIGRERWFNRRPGLASG